MLVLKASANDLELGLNELFELALGPHNPASRRAAQTLLALYDSRRYPLDVHELMHWEQRHQRQAVSLITFIIQSGVSLDRFISRENIERITDHWRDELPQLRSEANHESE